MSKNTMTKIYMHNEWAERAAGTLCAGYTPGLLPGYCGLASFAHHMHACRCTRTAFPQPTGSPPPDPGYLFHLLLFLLCTSHQYCLPRPPQQWTVQKSSLSLCPFCPQSSTQVRGEGKGVFSEHHLKSQQRGKLHWVS